MASTARHQTFILLSLRGAVEWVVGAYPSPERSKRVGKEGHTVDCNCACERGSPGRSAGEEQTMRQGDKERLRLPINTGHFWSVHAHGGRYTTHSLGQKDRKTAKSLLLGKWMLLWNVPLLVHGGTSHSVEDSFAPLEFSMGRRP